MNRTNSQKLRRGLVAGALGCSLLFGFSQMASATPLPLTVYADDFNDGNLAGWSYNASLWSNPGTELQFSGGGGQDWALYSTAVLPLAVFSADMDSVRDTASPYNFGGIMLSKSLGNDARVMAGWETHADAYPGFYKARITYWDGVGGFVHLESSGIDMMGATTFHLQLERAEGSNILVLEVSNGVNTQTVATPALAWLNDLAYIGAFRDQGSPIKYDNLLLTTVPEPSTALLLAVGVVATCWAVRRRR